MHWSEKIAKDIIKRSPDKEEYVCAAGISPSGSIHIGNFRDIATSYFVYKALIKQVTSKDILPGVMDFLNESKKQGILLAVASASKNARTVLEGLGILSMFDYVADASKIRYTKPDPEVFIDCMEHLKLQPWECIAFEDAAAGIEAIQAANIAAVGIGASVKPAVPDVFLDNTEELSIEKIENLLYK